MHSCWTEEEGREREIGIKRRMDMEDEEMERETDKEGETDR